MDSFACQIQCEDVCGEDEYYAAQEWAAECERERQRELQDQEDLGWPEFWQMVRDQATK